MARARKIEVPKTITIGLGTEEVSLLIQALYRDVSGTRSAQEIRPALVEKLDGARPSLYKARQEALARRRFETP